MNDYQKDDALIQSTLDNVAKMNLIEVETFLQKLSAQRHISIFWYTFHDIYHLSGVTEEQYLSFSERIEILKVMDEDASNAIMEILGGIARTAIEDVVSRRL
jgi:hypothetical protein